MQFAFTLEFKFLSLQATKIPPIPQHTPNYYHVSRKPSTSVRLAGPAVVPGFATFGEMRKYSASVDSNQTLIPRSQLAIALDTEEDFPAASHIADCQHRILMPGTYTVDPSDWHLLLGCRYAPFNNAWQAPILSFWPRAAAIDIPSAYCTSVSRNSGVEAQTMEELDVEALLDFDENVDDLVMQSEEEGEMSDHELLEKMVSLACASLLSEDFR